MIQQVNQIRLFGLDVDVVRMAEAIALLKTWLDRRDGTCRYVVTPNTDHVVMFQQSLALRSAYAKASLCVADGMPVVVASRLLGRPLPERVTGQDLVAELFRLSDPNQILRVFLLGAGPGVADRAASNIENRWPSVQVVGTSSPPLGFEKDREDNQAIIAQINQTNSDVLIVGLGAPKQEMWMRRHYAMLNVPIALCVGATIDFLAGDKSRAPRWMQDCGLEWLHRMATEPRRLAPRYARDVWMLPQLMWREWSENRVSN